MTRTLILVVLGGLILLLALRSLSTQRLKERYALLMVFTGLPFFLLALWPEAVATIARQLHIQYQTVLILAVTGFFLLMTIKLLSIVSIQDRKITTLTQQVGILMAEKHAEVRSESQGPDA